MVTAGSNLGPSPHAISRPAHHFGHSLECFCLNSFGFDCDFGKLAAAWVSFSQAGQKKRRAACVRVD